MPVAALTAWNSVIEQGARIQDVAVGSRTMFERMNRVIARHEPRPVIDRVFDFEDTSAALHYLKSGRHIGKICITVASGRWMIERISGAVSATGAISSINSPCART